MTDAAALVEALYQHFHRWQDVADACNGKRLDHSRGYYQQVASGRIRKPSAETCAQIERALESPERLLTSNVSKRPRGNVSFSIDTRQELREIKTARGWTWVELGDLVLEMLRDRYG